VNTPFRSTAARTAAAVATALALGLASGATLTASAADQRSTGDAGSSGSPSRPRFVDQHGPVLPIPQLYLIYWGTAWRSQTPAAPTPARVTGAVRALLASDYLTGLVQYRGSGRGVLRGSTLVTSSDPPAQFTDDQVTDFIDAQLAAGTVPGPDADNQTVYGVVLPAGVKPQSGDATGEHGYYERSGQRIHYAWFSNAGYLEAITGVVSHELVESATDPEGGGFLGGNGTCDGPGWCEIAAVCESTWWMLDGVMVQGYWSNHDNDCVVPGSAAPKRPATSPAAPTVKTSDEGRDAAPGQPLPPPAPGHTQVDAR
jgi:hypothetical protein